MTSLIITAVASLLDKFIPDKDKANQLAHEVATMAETHAHELAKAQIKVNEVEASHKSIFVSAWRPACGWTCTLALGFNYIGLPMLNYIGYFWNVPPAEPLNMEVMLPILLGMLGLGGLRTAEKTKGVARNSL